MKTKEAELQQTLKRAWRFCLSYRLIMERNENGKEGAW